MKTMLDKCAVAGDITQAIDRRGAWTCAVVIAGGTESTAVKLQSCDTADGSFTDFKTLISASEASASQYKGFVIDLDGAKKFIKVTGATMATCVLGDCDADVKKVTIKVGEVPSSADLEDNKEVSITENGTVEITPTAGKDGMKKVTATVNVAGSNEVYKYSTEFEGVYYYIITSKSSLTQLAIDDNVLYTKEGSYYDNMPIKVTNITEGVITLTSEYDSFTINDDTTADAHYSI